MIVSTLWKYPGRKFVDVYISVFKQQNMNLCKKE